MNFIDLIRFLATLIITNSHFDLLYPKSYAFLATGGALGNALFFFCSGYALYLSQKRSFAKYIFRRASKIYIPVWLFLIVSFIFGLPVKPVSFIIPPYWFLQAILVFYVLFFFVKKYLDKILSWCIILCVIPYITTYFLIDHSSFIIDNENNPSLIHWYYYFAIMLCGALCAQKKITFPNISILQASSLLCIVFIWMFCLPPKKLIEEYPEYINLQLIYPLFLGFIVFVFYLFCSVIMRKQSTILQKSKNLILYFSSITLEIYIVQFAIIKWCTTLTFPLKFLLAITFIVAASSILKYTDNKISKYINNKWGI